VKNSFDFESLATTDFKKIRHDFNRILYGLETAASIPSTEDKETRHKLLVAVKDELSSFTQSLGNLVERSLGG